MPRPRSLWPREHGAYAQLAAPIVAALLSRILTLSSALLAAAAVAAFLANEPLLIVLGHRGPRVRTSDGPRAKRRLVALVAFAAACGIGGLAVSSRATLVMAGLAFMTAVALVVLAWRRGQHSLAGELVAAVALPAAAAPVAVASGTEPRVAGLIWIAWAIGYAASVVAVHRVLARHRTAATRVDHFIQVVLGASIAAVALLGSIQPVLLLAVPLIGVSAMLVMCPPSARRLRAIGVGLVVASAASIALVVAIA